MLTTSSFRITVPSSQKFAKQKARATARAIATAAAAHQQVVVAAPAVAAAVASMHIWTLMISAHRNRSKFSSILHPKLSDIF